MLDFLNSLPITALQALRRHLRPDEPKRRDAFLHEVDQDPDVPEGARRLLHATPFRDIAVDRQTSGLMLDASVVQCDDDGDF